jgi:hypothetical protein
MNDNPERFYQPLLLFNQGLNTIPPIPLQHLEDLYLYKSDVVYREPQSLPTLLQSILHIYTPLVDLDFWQNLKIQEIKMTLAYNAGNLEELLYAGRICAHSKFLELFAVEKINQRSMVIPEYKIEKLLNMTSKKLNYRLPSPSYQTNLCLVHYVLYTDFHPTLFARTNY